jgi:hypothetical protein
MRAINLEVPEDLYNEYRKACASTGTKLRYHIIMKINEVVRDYKKKKARA